MSNTTEDWTEGLSEKDIEFYHKIESIGSGELKGWPRAPQGRLRVNDCGPFVGYICIKSVWLTPR